MSFGTVVSIVCVCVRAVCREGDRAVQLLRLVVVILVAVLGVQNAVAVILAPGELQFVQPLPQLLPLLLLLLLSEDVKVRT